MRCFALVAVAALLVAGLAGCASSAPAASTSGRVAVVASTDVWGDVVQQIGGDHVSVTSIIDDPNRDPHEYQADARDQLAVSRAAIIVENGGGYDDFMTKLAGSAAKTAVLINAAAVSGRDQKPATGDFNEHLWYDFPTVQRVANRAASALTAADPSHRSAYASGLATFTAALTNLEQQEATLKAEYAGQGAAITEPVPLYLLDAIGLVNRTPASFSAAIEAGNDVPVDALHAELQLLATHRVAVLVYDEQTAGPTSQQMLAAAKAANVPAVAVRETLPDGSDYLQWMRHDLAAIGTALHG